MEPSSFNHKENGEASEAQKKRSVGQAGPLPPSKRTKMGLSFPADFEKHRSSVILRKDEIWAVRDKYGMPRRYALIEKDGDIHSTSIRFLKHDRTINFIKQSVCGALNTCGTFVINYGTPKPLEPPVFSHKVIGWGKDNSSKYTIYPRKGEVWAIRKDASTSLFGDHSPTLCKYEMVEVLEDYNFVKGTQVVTLVRVKGGSQSLFGRPPAKDTNHFRYCPKWLHDIELNKFSHQVPYFRVSGDRCSGDCFELDPLSLPLYIEDFQGIVDPEINDNYLCLGILDQKACRFCNSGFVWAAYDRQYGMPLKYVVFLKDSETKRVMHEVVPRLTSENERRWHAAGLPIACGKFKKLKTHVEIENNLILAHKVSSPLKDGDYYYSIYPVPGDVWAVYRGRNVTMKDKLEYQIVEIVRRNERIIDIAPLVRVEGFKSLFRRKKNLRINTVFQILADESYRFLHKIPSYRTNERFGRQLQDAFILDPLLVPNKDGEIFSFSDSFLLERSKAHPLWSAICYIVDKQRNGICLYSQENSCQQSENCVINLTEEQQDIIVENEREGKPNLEETPPTKIHDSEGTEADVVEHEIVCRHLNIKFHDFDDSKSEKNFELGRIWALYSELELGQIWALYSELDGAPHSYARIDKFIPSGGMVVVTLLEPHPMAAEEIQWVEENLPMACGTFRASRSNCIKEVTLFSHRVICDEGKSAKLFYRVFPRKGEVWAIYEPWNPSWGYSYLKKNVEYKLVEVTSDFSEEAGVTVAALVRVEGQEDVFRRHLLGDFGLFKTFTRKELLRFSHRIPSFKMTGGKDDNTCEGSVKLKFSHNGIS